MPETLDKTYERILSQIPKEYHYEARVVFALLICSTRPVSLTEAAEATAVTIESESFDMRNRLRDPLTILKICSSFVTLSPFERHDSRIATCDGDKTLRFAHYSVREYLVSERAPAKFKITADDASKIITRISISYLLSMDDAMEVIPSTFKALPFLLYASRNWSVHAKTFQKDRPREVNALILRLFDKSNTDKLKNLVCICDPDRPYSHPSQNNKFVSRLYYASLFGFVEACENILKGLEAASFAGHEAVVRLLLDEGAEVNAQGGHYGNALEAASFGGHEAVVRLLLDEGAERQVGR